MISRLTTFATVFSVAVAASLSYAASAQTAARTPVQDNRPAAAAKQVRIVQLERVVIIAKRLPRESI